MAETIIQLTWQDPATEQVRQYTGTLPITIGSRDDNTVVLKSGYISRKHAQIEPLTDDTVRIVDLGSRNGIKIDGQRVESADLTTGDSFGLGPFQISVAVQVVSEEEAEEIGATAVYRAVEDDDATKVYEVPDISSTIAIAVDDLEEQPEEVVIESDHAPTQLIDINALKQQAERPHSFPPPIFDQPVVQLDELRETGLPIEETTYLALGGGVGSYSWVDVLLISGVDPSMIRVVGIDDKPYQKYERLCVNSQIPRHERLRSDSGSTPDNIWGWPGYAVREIYYNLRRGRVLEAGRLAWQIFGEPTFYQTYTPISGNVFDSFEREMARIRWSDLWTYGSIRAIRKTDDGRFVVAYSQSRRNKSQPHRFIVGKYVHIALGYPAIRLLGDLTDYRVRTGDFEKVVNAYEPHDHVYESLAEKGGTVLVRGRGIVASRIIQHIYEARQQNPNIGIVHLMRSPNREGAKYGPATRKVENHWEMQPLNWPKGAVGGYLRDRLEQGTPEQRNELLTDWGGTTTADRVDWRQMIQAGLDEGWYNIQFAQVTYVDQDEDGMIVSHLQGRANQPASQVKTDFVIDATGLVASVDANPVLHDLVTTYELSLNVKGRLDVSNTFELEDLGNGEGRIFAAGIMTLGGPFAMADSFIGLQYAALRSTDNLLANKAEGVKALSPWRSLNQWIRWARGVHP